MIQQKKFDRFNVYFEDCSHQFEFIVINPNDFYKEFASYILDFEMIRRHAMINIGIESELTILDYNEILNRLMHLVDYEKIYNIADFDEAVLNILDVELMKKDSDFRRDKWGRIGEYIFNIILDAHFKLDCIVRKFALNTSRNMSVYGIDTVHCSLEDKTFYFGESKTVNSVNNGVELIKKSLQNYEAQISEEYFTIKNNNFTRSTKFLNIFEDYLNRCLSFDELIHKLELEKIGIPIFIAHGDNLDITEIFNKFKTIPQKKIFGLETKYIFISLPLYDKEKFRIAFVECINEKIKECKECIRKI